MTTTSDAAQQSKAELFLGLGRPTPRSPLWAGFSALLLILFSGWFLWVLIERGWDDLGLFSLGLLSMILSQFCDTGGGLLYLRWGAEWGRTLRVLGFAVFLPLALILWVIGSWIQSSPVFPLFALILGGFAAIVAVRVAAVSRRGARWRGGQ